MLELFERIARYAGEQPARIAMADGRGQIDYRQLQETVPRLAATLNLRRIGLLMDNGCAQAMLDLAAGLRGAVRVALPVFFSDSQLQHLIEDAGLEMIFTDQPERVAALVDNPRVATLDVAGRSISSFIVMPRNFRPLPPHIATVTYTSGTTGKPKGVCLTGAAIGTVMRSLCGAIDAGRDDNALTLLPQSTLLAAIAGVYAPLYSGATACLPGLAECGLHGSTGVASQGLLETLQRYRPGVTVLVPHLLKQLVEALQAGATVPESLRFVAVGGAPVSTQLLQRARALGLPVYQGYGLSEASSVVSLNLPGDDRIDSVGRPLPHTHIRIAADGEIIVGGALCCGYLDGTFAHDREWRTGDLGHLDEDGFLHVTGRRKTVMITAHGRKLSPEWVESELTAHAEIAQAALFGEGRSSNVAVLVASTPASDIGRAIAAANRSLPDYARVGHWIVADEPFTRGNGLADAGGAINRPAIAARYLGGLAADHNGDCSCDFMTG